MTTVGAPPAKPAYQLGFKSLDREAREIPLPVSGDIPFWLDGVLLRTGPARFEVGGRSYAHWFDGLAMLHSFALDRGRVTYSSRFLRSRAFQEAEERNCIARSEFMTDPCRGLFGRVMSLFDPKATDNGCVNVAKLAGHMVALTETPMPIAFDPATLETLGPLAPPPSLRGHMTTAHPHHDGERGYSYAICIGRRSSYRLLVEEGGSQRVLAELPVDEPAYMHSFGMSENYLVLTEFPLRVHPLRLALSKEPFIHRYRWCPERKTVITVIDKRDGSIAARACASPCFAFHHVNAFEEDGFLAVDLLQYPDARIIDQLRLARLREGQPMSPAGRLTRFRVPLEKRNPLRTEWVEHEFLGDARLELPRIDYTRRAGRRYQYVWGNGQSRGGDFLDTITKLELRAGGEVAVRTWRARGCYPGEPVFVARPGGTAEDDGLLLSVVLDSVAGRSFLLVLDAATLTERGRATVPHHIPFGFHGEHFSGGEIPGMEPRRAGQRAL